MSKILKMIESFVFKIRAAETGWQSPSGEAYLNRRIKEMDKDLVKYNMDEIMTYIAAKITQPEENSNDYPTINFEKK